jgi:site-specific DNA-methyltransferase (adenine-specific)
MGDNSVDAVVTDPPYGLSFMGKKWDYDVPSVEVWAECLRVLKPGGHLLAFAGTRTQHRMAVRIEDAGFEIRDMIAWVYGSGFPKSLDVSKAIDRAAGATGTYGEPKSAAHAGWLDRGQMRGSEGNAGWQRPWMDDPTALSNAARKYAPATPEARQWAGWGTALKPALEPITVARKPLEGTVAANVLAHGTGGLNVDGCRVEGLTDRPGTTPASEGTRNSMAGDLPRQDYEPHTAGRWPANLIHDGSEEVVACFPQSKGQQGAVTGAEPSSKTANAFGEFAGRTSSEPRGDSGSAARFFYCAKASRSDRSDGNTHPTVKPTDLMRYLCRLVTPPGGVVLDPFMGSGSTGKAALLEGLKFVGIERDPAYFQIANARIKGDEQMSLL